MPLGADGSKFCLYLIPLQAIHSAIKNRVSPFKPQGSRSVTHERQSVDSVQISMDRNCRILYHHDGY